MKLSLVFELLLIFVLLAFAASKSVKKYNYKKGIQKRDDVDDKPEESGINKYCKCSEAYCNCCRDFALPVVNLSGPGCASLMYLNDDKMSVSLSFGKKVITNRTLSGRKPSPVCMPLPGGVSKFCGRVYNIARAGEEFRACLGLELQAKRTVEAAVRVSCFKFGPRGVTSEPADPLPLVPQDEKDEDDDDDDDDDEDDFGLGGDDDDDDDDDDDEDEDDEDDGGLDAVNDVDGTDYTGFSLLGEDLLGDLFGSSGGKKSNKNKKKQAPYVPIFSSTTTRRPRPTRRPARRPSTRTTTQRPTRSTTVKIRPVNRRPTRRPVKRPEVTAWPEKKPIAEITPIAISTSTVSTLAKVPVIESIQSSENIEILAASNDHSMATIVTKEPEPNLSVTVATINDVSNFEDPGLEMSLAHITGQLSSMQVSPLLPTTAGDLNMPEIEQINYEKVETITPKLPSTAAPTVTSEEAVDDDMIQVVQTLDSEESTPEQEVMATEESRAHWLNSNSEFESYKLPKRKNRNQIFGLDDLDVLDLTEIGESIGDQFGIFGGKRRQNKQNKEVKLREEKGRDNDEYDDILDTLTDTLIMRRSNLDTKNDRRRQNKMIHGEWS